MSAFVVFIAGLCIGSFLNVCIYRIPKNKSITYPPSTCPKCNTPIKIYDNIPVLSYLILRGRCRTCSEQISLKYPLVEFITGLLCVFFFLKFGLEKIYFYHIMIILYLIVLAFIDINERIVPDIIVAFMIITGLCFGVFEVRAGISVFDGVIGAVSAGIIIQTLCFFSNGKISEGDTTLIAALGLCVGIKEIILIINYSFVIGGLYALLMLLLGKHKKNDAIAFVPFIAVAFILRSLLQ